ncbi:type II secretion system protein GspM [Desulfuromonas soudanensis]|uniref:Type II secretion system protein GspM n=1 Tax=Desulfuromonas soudanensis TaxID=1603606 RepID=A0A0M4D7C2_9BACT|nr:type II secretion system protein GspM [Desulfuromonas soudanensis]ALC15355.1 type II secretion system protein GspM [Desulfuromonas soudanensis]
MISNLSPRDRNALIIGLAAVLIAVFYLGIVSPYQSAIARLDSQIASRQRQLQEVQVLRQRYLSLQGALTQAERRGGSNRTFSLFSFVENLTGQIASRENLVYMRPQPVAVKDEFKEESVEIKLEKIALDQLVRILYQIDTADAFLQVKNLRLKVRFDNKAQFDAVLTISAYERNA